jgi:ketosteroid isomerase-like protein
VPEGPEELLRKLLDAFNREGVEATFEYLDPEIRWLAPPDWLEDRVYEGHEGIRRLSGFWTAQFDDYRVEPEEFIDLGEGRILALLYQRGRIRSSHDPIEQTVAWLVEIRGGLITKVEIFFSFEEGRAAAGLASRPTGER